MVDGCSNGLIKFLQPIDKKRKRRLPWTDREFQKNLKMDQNPICQIFVGPGSEQKFAINMDKEKSNFRNIHGPDC
jgi:hypothetical protein